MSRDRNVSAAIGVGVYAAVLGGAVIAVLLLPSSVFFGYWMFWMPVALLLALPFLLRKAEQSRIRDEIERTGGRVLNMRRQTSWSRLFDNVWGGTPYRNPWRGPKYRVEFVDLLGTRYVGICRTSLIYGVEWLNKEQLADATF